ncbi:MAG: peptide MFS transporter [Myxococcaceae bacterium]|nr:peptide MFS transporter [Myxococcaceae bacterium]
MSNAEAAVPQGHPKGLYVLFATEMWERFSYYGMRALLVLYLISYQQFAPSDASSVYKWYTSLVYLTPLLGGFLADRYLGLRRSITMGGILMAIGHFLMAFEALPFLYAALGFLILGNGFFKPNISTMVGKMYRPGDSRRDGAFSIFYMGINLGAGLSPLVCGYLRQHYGFHYGFAAAGVGMVIGLVVFTVMQKRVQADIAAAGNSDAPGAAPAAAAGPTGSDAEQQPGATGFAGVLASIFPIFLLVLAVVVPALYVFNALQGQTKWVNVIMPSAFALVGGAMGLTLRTIRGAAKDQSTVIFLFFAFVVLFWMAFEQAGNALNIWAEFNTKAQLGPITTTAEWYQSVNAIFIVALAPVFGIVWVAFAKRGMEVPTAVKVLLAMIFTTLSFVCMVFAARSENETVTRVELAEIPAPLSLADATKEQRDGLAETAKLVQLRQPAEAPKAGEAPGPERVTTLHAGRMLFDPATHQLIIRGTLPPFAVMDALRPTVDAKYVGAIDALEGAVAYADEKKPGTAKLEATPPDFQLPALPGLKSFDPATGEITLTQALGPVDKAALIAAGAPAAWRTAIGQGATGADAARVSGWWLVLQYLFATLAELCISPVGLSMVTKLAPARFASLFMGVFFLGSSVAQYVGGALGELWGTVPPAEYFVLFVVTSAVGAVVLLPLIAPIRKLMHQVV